MDRVNPFTLARFGWPKTIITDNGRQYTSNAFKELLQNFGIHQRFNAPYAPQTNPTERVNRTIKTMIAQYVQNKHQHWDEHLPELMFALNTARQESTGFSPAYLNFGRELTLPNCLYNEHTTIRNQTDEPHTIKERLKNTLEIVRSNLAKAFSHQQRNYNLRRRKWTPRIGDWVYIATHHLSNAAQHHTSKLMPKFEGPVRIEKLLSPVIFSVRLENGTTQRVHISNCKAADATDSL